MCSNCVHLIDVDPPAVSYKCENMVSPGQLDAGISSVYLHNMGEMCDLFQIKEGDPGSRLV